MSYGLIPQGYTRQTSYFDWSSILVHHRPFLLVAEVLVKATLVIAI